MSKLRVSRDAAADLDEIWLYIAKRGGVEAAQRHINHLTGKFDIIALTPGMGRERNELKSGIRSHAVDDYVVYYRQKKGLVTILHVMHGARDVKELFR